MRSQDTASTALSGVCSEESGAGMPSAMYMQPPVISYILADCHVARLQQFDSGTRR